MRPVALAFLLLLGFGCDDSTISPAQAKADCSSLFTKVFCPKVVSCDPSITMQECLDTLNAVIDCSAVTGEPGNLDTCQSQLSSASCATVNNPDTSIPASCKGLFTH